MKNYITILVLLLLTTHCLRAQIITTYAGDLTGDTTDGIPATDAMIAISCIATDISGNVYFGGWDIGRVRKVSTSGIIYTVAGNGYTGFSGDGGPATAARLSGAGGLAVDSSGNLYIADGYNSCIRKVSASSGIISTVVGIPLSFGYSGDGGPATAATLNFPAGVAIDHFGNIYITDVTNYVIRKISRGGIITTFAGNGFFGDSGDGGPATAASLFLPDAIAVDTIGNVYIVENQYRDSLSYVRKVNTSGIITTIAGNGRIGYSGDGEPATDAAFNGISGIAVDKFGNIILSEQNNNVIRVINTSGIVTTYTGNGTGGFSGDGGPANRAQLYGPEGAVVDTGNNMYIADSYNARIRKVSAPPADLFVPLVNDPSMAVKVFPNPSAGHFTIALPTVNNEITIVIEDMLARTIETRNIPNNTARQFNFSLSQSGTYIIKITADNVNYREKIIIW